jgi:hypothetical protein
MAPFHGAIAIVRVPMPWYLPRWVVRGKFHEYLAEYEAIPNLEAKYFTISDRRELGGIYVWASRADAERYYDDAWHRRVRARLGVAADLVVLDATHVVEGRARLFGRAEGTRSTKYPAVASVTFGSADADERATYDAPELVRAFAVDGSTSPATRGRGLVALWATRRSAEGGLDAPPRTLFEAPLLIDATLR